VFGTAAQKKTSVAIKSIPGGATIEVDGKPAGTARDTLVVGDLEVGRAYPIVAKLEGHKTKEVVVQPRASDSDNAVTVELEPLAASVVLESVPTGATVEIDGKPAGTTPLTIANLPPGTAATVVFKKSGFQDATTKVEVPKAGKEMRLVQPLAVSMDLARVRLVSDPPGAQVMVNGQLLAGVTTPAEVLVEADKPVRFTLTMEGKVPVALEAFTPARGADNLERSGKLVDGAALHVTANLDGKISITNAPHCQTLPAPADCIVAPGTHIVELVVPAATRIVRTVKVGTADVDVKFELGFVEAGAGKTIKLGGGPGVRRAVFEVGSRRVMVSDGDGTRAVTVVVKPGATTVVN
jgi:hypothetical protein